ncbi:hypothetical protein UFOVP340_46 [uncultured Caudovirales phage]|uniref:Uncharacterized protein n=1 Tax=uncultured Caudovirales phage TaxID=2100421 RepID=A0A6J5M364_9CAUD|nr:hypothetical protein UFOVP340_46 [uncultured Caudovirales phage]
MSEDPNADIGTAENNTEAQSNAHSSGLNEETLALKLRETLFADGEQAVESQAENEDEAQTEVKDDPETADATQAEASDEVPQAEDGDDVHSQEAQEDEVDSDLPKGVQKRIDKLTAKRKQAEEEVASLRQEMEALKQAMTEAQQASATNETSVTDANNPFSTLKSKAEVDKEIEQARWLRYKCMENPQGFILGETEYGSEDVSRMLVNATKAIEEHLPRQMARIDTESKIKPIAEAAYPWWKSPQSQEYQVAQQILRTAPELKKFPDWQIWIGDAIAGMKMRESATKPAQAQKKAPVQPVRPTASPAKVSRTEASAKTAVNRFAKSTSADDLAKVLLSKGFI